MLMTLGNQGNDTACGNSSYLVIRENGKAYVDSSYLVIRENGKACVC